MNEQRRRWLKQIVNAFYLLPNVVPTHCYAAQSTEEPAEKQLKLVKDLGNGAVLAPSPDGRRLLVFGGSGIRRFFVTPKGSGEVGRQPTMPLCSLDIRTWKSEWEVDLRGQPTGGGYFADSERCLVNTLKDWQMFDTAGTKLLQKDLPSLPAAIVDGRWYHVRGYKDELAIVGIGRKDDPTEWMIINISNGSEVRRQTHAVSRPTGRGPANSSVPPTFATNPEYFAHAAWEQVVLRRSADLSIISIATGNPAFILSDIGLSHHGAFVGASYAVIKRTTHRSTGYVGIETCVFEGSTGKMIQRFDLDSMEGVAISQDGKYLATACSVDSPRFREYIDVVVRVTEIGTGKLVGVGKHARIFDSSGSRLAARLGGLFFVPNSNLLVSSGVQSKVWEIP